jgi:hypothetical protein
VAHVDLTDDSIRRYIVRHYRYDPDRHERRHVVVAVIDSKWEYRAELQRANAALEGRRVRGEDVDPREHITGTIRQPGDDRRAAHGHLLTCAFEHGVRLGDWVDDLDLPGNVGLMRSAEHGSTARSLRARLARWLSGGGSN